MGEVLWLLGVMPRLGVNLPPPTGLSATVAETFLLAGVVTPLDVVVKAGPILLPLTALTLPTRSSTQASFSAVEIAPNIVARRSMFLLADLGPAAPRGVYF